VESKTPRARIPREGSLGILRTAQDRLNLTWILSRIRRTAVQGEAGISDGALLERFAATGDQAAFELLVWRHQRLVFGVCRRILHDFHDAEDALQATFLILARKSQSISKHQALAGWLYRVAYRVALSARPARERGEAQPLEAVEEVPAPASQEVGVEQQEVRAFVDEEVSRLPEKLRTATVLCYLEGKTVDETARQLGCPRGTVASRLARARERLRVRLTQRGLMLSAAAVVAALGEAGSFARASDSLVSQIVRAASPAGQGPGPAGVSARVSKLTEEVLRIMFMQKITKAAVVLIAFAATFLLGSGVALRIYAGGMEQPAAVADDPPQAQPAKDQAKEPAPGPLPVIVQKPVWREFTPFQDFTGRLGLRSQVDVRSPVAGVVKNVFVKPNATVRKGDRLFEITRMKDLNVLLQAEDVLAKEERKHQLATSKWRDAQKAYEAGKISAQDLAQAATENKLAEAAEEKARISIGQAQLKMAPIKVVSPLDGQVVRLNCSTGTGVDEDSLQSYVFVQIATVDTITFSFHMDERTYLQYRRLLAKGEVKGVGTTVKTQLADEEGYPGKAVITGYDSQVNAQTDTIGIHCTLPDPEHILLPGMFVRVRMPVGKASKVLEIPEECLHSDQAMSPGSQLSLPGGNKAMNPGMGMPGGTGGNPVSHWVWVVNDMNNVERRDVELGTMDGDMRVIKKGLSPEDRVIVLLPKALRAGERVDPQTK